MDGWSSVLVLILAAIFLVYKYISRNDDYWAERGVHHLPRANILYFFYKVYKMPLVDVLQDMYKKAGKRVYGTFEFSTPSLVVAEPNLLRDILVKDFHIFPIRRDQKFGDEFADASVGQLQGDDWKRVRTIITPAFTSKRMRQMGSIIDECSKTVIDVCEKKYENGETVECRGMFGAFTMDVIASTAFGTKIDSHNDPNNIFVKKAKEFFLMFSFFRFFLKVITPKWILSVLHYFNIDVDYFFRDVIVQVIKERKASGKRYNDVLQILMDAREENSSADHSDLNEDEKDHFGSITNSGNGVAPTIRYKNLSESELLAQCVMFFFVGYETTASTLSHVAYCLALNPEWQEKLIVEVDRAFEKHAEMSHDVVRDMKILDAVISETMRMYPSVLVTERTAAEDYSLGDTGITVKKGMRIGIPIYSMQRDPELFEDPEKFNPDRFMDPSQMKHHQYAYQPFGAGPRNCLGMRLALLEMKICLTNLLRHFRIRKHSTTRVPPEYQMGVGFLSMERLHLAVEKRTDVKIS